MSINKKAQSINVKSASDRYLSITDQRLKPFFKPALPWILILGFALTSLACILAGAGQILNFFFPAGAFAIAIFLYFRYPILYMGFCWWICFLTALVRRLADYRGGFTNPSPILLSPFLVILVTIVTLYQNLPKTYREGGLLFVLSFVAVFYGFMVGISIGSPFRVVQGTLQWLTPVLLGFHLFSRWRYYPEYQQNIQRTFVWGVLVMGIYGIFQYLVAPAWDRFWLVKVEMLTAGIPEPLGIRVWSTMNGPLVFGVTIMAGLLLLFNYRGFLSLPASIAGYLAFLLSLVRTAWAGWFVGLFTLFFSLKSSLKIRLIIIFVVMAVCIISLTNIEPFSEVINARFDSFSNIENDGSAVARKETYSQLLIPALTSFFGYGIGNMPNLGFPLDSTILTMLFSVGWFGTIFYMGGWILLSLKLFRGSEIGADTVASTARAVVASAFFMLFFTPAIFAGILGVVMWGFLGMGMAAQKYYRHQSIYEQKSG